MTLFLANRISDYISLASTRRYIWLHINHELTSNCPSIQWPVEKQTVHQLLSLGYMTHPSQSNSQSIFPPQINLATWQPWLALKIEVYVDQVIITVYLWVCWKDLLTVQKVLSVIFRVKSTVNSKLDSHSTTCSQ